MHERGCGACRVAIGDACCIAGSRFHPHQKWLGCRCTRGGICHAKLTCDKPPLWRLPKFSEGPMAPFEPFSSIQMFPAPLTVSPFRQVRKNIPVRTVFRSERSLPKEVMMPVAKQTYHHHHNDDDKINNNHKTKTTTTTTTTRTRTRTRTRTTTTIYSFINQILSFSNKIY